MAVTEITKILFRRGRESDRRQLESYGGLAQGEPGFTSAGRGQGIPNSTELETQQVDADGNLRGGFLHPDDAIDTTTTPFGGGDLFMGAAGGADVFIGGTSGENHWQRYFVSLYGTRKNKTWESVNDTDGQGSTGTDDTLWGYINGTFQIGKPAQTAGNCQNQDAHAWDVIFYGWQSGAGTTGDPFFQHKVEWDSSVGKLDVRSQGAMTVPRGLETTRPVTESTTVPVAERGSANFGTAASGDIRFNTNLLTFEGYNGSAWVQFGAAGVVAEDRQTYITVDAMGGDDGVVAGTGWKPAGGSGWQAASDEINWVVNGDHVLQTTSTLHTMNVPLQVSQSLSTTSTTFNLLNTNAATINFGQASSAMTIGNGGAGFVSLTNTTDASTSTDGALRVAGGASVAQNLVVGEDVVAFFTSDERLKANIEQIDDALERTKQLRGVNFTWRDNAPQWVEGTLDETRADMGMIAQDVEKVIPQAVQTRADGTKAVDYKRVIPLLIESIKTLAERVEQLESKN